MKQFFNAENFLKILTIFIVAIGVATIGGGVLILFGYHPFISYSSGGWFVLFGAILFIASFIWYDKWFGL